MRASTFLLSVACVSLIAPSALAEAYYPFPPESIDRAGLSALERLLKATDLPVDQRDALKAAILRSGPASGVDQGGYSDCWFEAAVGALSRLPKGREILSQMIT